MRLGITELDHDGTTWIQINDKPFEYIVRADVARLHLYGLILDFWKTNL